MPRAIKILKAPCHKYKLEFKYFLSADRDKINNLVT